MKVVKIFASLFIGALLCVGGFLLTQDKDEIRQNEIQGEVDSKDFQQDEGEPESEIYLENYNLQNIIDFSDGLETKQRILEALEKKYDKSKVFGRCSDVKLKKNTDNIVEFEISIFDINKKTILLGKHKVEVEVTENRVQMFDISKKIKEVKENE